MKSKESNDGVDQEEWSDLGFREQYHNGSEMTGCRSAFGAGLELFDADVDPEIVPDAITGLPDYRITGAEVVLDEDWSANRAAGHRREEEGVNFIASASMIPAMGCPSGQEQSGSPVVRQSGHGVLENEGAEGVEDVDPTTFMPRILANYARSHARNQNISLMGAAAAAVAAASTSLGKAYHVKSRGEAVHPNLQILNVGKSGVGKKAFQRPKLMVTEVLGEIEARSRKEAARHASELRKAEKEMEEAKAKGESARMEQLDRKIDELRSLASPRRLSFGEDATLAFVARELVKPGQGGMSDINSGEGAMFFQRVAGSSKNDPGYATLLTKGFNDPEYVISRYDEGRETHGKVLNPRLSLSISIQSNLVPQVVAKIPASIGVFQRFNYVIEERRLTLAPTASLFSSGSGACPWEIAFSSFVKELTRRCWDKPLESIELRFSEEAKFRLDELMRRNHELTASFDDSEPVWGEYVCRWTEQVIKLVQTFHVANCADQRSGEVDLVKVGKPISGVTVDSAIRFHEIWSQHTRRFFELWIKPVRTGIEGLTCEQVKEAMWKALKSHDPGSKGVPGGDVLKYLPKGTRAEEFNRVIADNPQSFEVNIEGIRGRKLYLPKMNVVDFRKGFLMEGEQDVA